MSVLYKQAASVLQKVEKKRGSLNSLVFCSNIRELSLKKKLYALLTQAIKYKSVIVEVIRRCDLLQKEPKFSLHLGIVTVYDFLLGKGLQCGGPIKQAILRHKNALQKAFNSIGNHTRLSSLPDRIPRYARINLLKTTVSKVLHNLLQEGYVQVDPVEFRHCFKSCVACNQSTVTRSKDEVVTCDSSQLKFCQDELIPYLLAFCPCALLTKSQLYDEGEIILQDKASCLPAYLLDPIAGSSVIDACAAPGNKTSHIASIMNNFGTIHAFDKDAERYSTLETMTEKYGVSCAVLHLQDFLQTCQKDYEHVKYILVDPSCSGSGMGSKIEFSADRDRSRLRSLSRFQCRILQHALSFPSVLKIVYSTCSVHKEENECVVKKALDVYKSDFELVELLPDWSNRGLPVFKQGKYCIRASANDLTCGFFVAMFQRKERRHSMQTSCADGSEPTSLHDVLTDSVTVKSLSVSSLHDVLTDSVTVKSLSVSVVKKSRRRKKLKLKPIIA